MKTWVTSMSSLAPGTDVAGDPMLPSGSDDSINGVSKTSQQAAYTSFQIPPVKAHTEMLTAIRRQGQTGCVEYKKSSRLIIADKQTSKRAVTLEVNCCIPPVIGVRSSIHHSGVRGVDLDINGNDSSLGSKNNVKKNSRNRKQHDVNTCNRVTSVDRGVHGAAESHGGLNNATIASTGSGANSGLPLCKATLDTSGRYSVVFSKHFKMTTHHDTHLRVPPLNGSAGRVYPSNPCALAAESTGRIPKLTLTHRYARGSTTGVMVQIDDVKPLLTLKSQNGGSMTPKLGELPANGSCSSPREVTRSIDIIHGTEPAATQSSSTGKNVAYTQIDTKKITQDSRTSRSQELSCVHLANSLLSAIGPDLSQAYKLCQTRLGYADFIESSEPHRLEEDRTGSTLASASSYRLPRHQTALSLSPSSVPVNSPSPVPQPGTPRVKPFSCLSRGANSKHPCCTAADNFDSGNSGSHPQPVSEIDYDKPITIIVESNCKDPLAKATKPILKTPSRGNALILKGASDVRNGPNHNDTSTNVTSPLSECRSKHAGTVYTSHKHQEPPAGRGCSTESYKVNGMGRGESKGRLVRFSTDAKIHEFVPCDPVNLTGAV